MRRRAFLTGTAALLLAGAAPAFPKGLLREGTSPLMLKQFNFTPINVMSGDTLELTYSLWLGNQLRAAFHVNKSFIVQEARLLRAGETLSVTLHDVDGNELGMIPVEVL